MSPLPHLTFSLADYAHRLSATSVTRPLASFPQATQAAQWRILISVACIESRQDGVRFTREELFHFRNVETLA
jgi:hypothetical protein